MTNIFVKSQNALIWSTYFGGPGYDLPNQYYDHTITTDPLGNVYVVGYTNSTVGIASGGFQDIYGGGAFDAYLVKYDANGNQIWATYYGGSGDDQGYAVSTDNNGNVYLAGFTSSTDNIASGGFQNTYGGGTSDAFIVKFNANGNRVWGSYFGGESNDNLAGPVGVNCDGNGNVYLIGSTVSISGIASGGFQNNNSGQGDAYLVKFDSNGIRIWSTYYGGSLGEFGCSVITDSMDNVIITGYTMSTTNIASGGFQNTHAGSVNNTDAFLVKFDTDGNRLWATYYGGPGEDSGLCVSTDGSNVYLAGISQSISGISSGGFQNNNGGGINDAFLVKFESGGNRIWATYYGGNGEETGNVQTDSYGNVILSGHTSSASSIASGGVQNNYGGGANDLYYVLFDSDGNRICSSYFGSTENEFGGQVVTNEDNIYIYGSTNSISGIASGGFQNSFAGGYTDAFLAKLSSCYIEPCSPTSSIENIIACEQYSWNSNIYFASGSHQDTILNSNGCDSILTINLTINQNTSSTQIASEFDSYTWPINNQTYTQSGTYSVIIPNASSCDSVVTLNLAITYTRINELNGNKLILSPNPTAYKISIKSNPELIGNEFIIYDQLGKAVKSGIITSENTEIDLTTLTEGMYLFKVGSEMKETFNIIKQ